MCNKQDSDSSFRETVISEHTHTITTSILEDFYTMWESNQLAANEIVIHSSSFAAPHEHPLFLPPLICTKLTIHNCQEITARKLQYILQSCDFEKMNEFSIIFDSNYEAELMPAAHIIDIATIISDKIAPLDFAPKENIKQNFTLKCDYSDEITRPDYYMISNAAKNFKIILNDTQIEPLARSVA